MKVRFCEHNKQLGKCSKRLKKEFPGENIKKKDCLKKCGVCHKSPFALVDGHTVVATDEEELLHKVIEMMRSAQKLMPPACSSPSGRDCLG